MRRILFAGSVVLALSIAAAAQLTTESVRRILVQQAGFTDAEVDRVNGRDVVVKVIPTDEKQDIAVVAVVRVLIDRSIDMARFRDSLDQKSSRSVASGGVFSTPPVIGDLKDMPVDERDLKELVNCRPGSCDLNLSIESIRSLQNNEPGMLRTRFLEAVAERASAYYAQGDGGLAPYRNRKDPFDVGSALKRALDGSAFLAETSPELRDYLIRFPRSDLAGVRNEFRWSRIDFGLNPAIVLTHTVTYSAKGDARIVVNKQFYGSRYLDASISIAYLLPVGQGSFYLVFTDFSRTDAFSGPLGSVARKLVVNEAVERTTEMLEKAELRLMSAPLTDQAAPEPSSVRGYLKPAIVILAILVLAAVVWYIARRS